MSHMLREKHGISFSDYCGMAPWMRDVYVQLILRDLEERRQKASPQ